MSPFDDSSERLEFGPQSFEGSEGFPPPDDLFRALANDKRRRLLTALDAEGSTELDDLTDLLVGWETTIDGPAGPDEWAQVKIELVHAHLPLLSDAGLIAYDTDADEVSLASIADPVESVLHFAGEYEEAARTGGFSTD